MTVSYTGDVANGSSFGCFWKILHRWKGSVYKLIWRELLAYLLIYYIFNFVYRFGLDSQQRTAFEKVKVYCSKQIESIPMSFVLGFYVSLIVKRWWEQYWLLPLPDNLALYISSSLHGQDERGRILRRTIMRYVILAYIITLQRISFRVKKRFPTLQHLVDAGLMMESEKKIFDKFEEKTTVSKFWMPTVWASNLVNRARLEGRIQSDQMLQTIIMELSDFRRLLGRVMIYDTVSVPLVYTQVVTLAVYTYFIAALLGRQWVHPEDEKIRSSIYPGYELDLHFPIFLALQFIFYVGWLKVAETLINPFGEDDDDFELNWLIDRHIQVSYMVVDEMHEEHPELLRDQYWEQVVPAELPYNHASGQFRRKEPQGSTASMKIKLNESVYDNLPAVKRNSSVIPDEVYADLESVTESPLVDNRKNWIQRQLSRVESFRSNSSSFSLSAKNRSGHHNGGLPNVVKNSGQRMSIYDKLMNRRSSKEKSAPRIPSRALPNGTAAAPMDTIMAPQARPRVPTPDVARETQISITTPSGDNIPISGKLPKNINPTNHSPGNPNLNLYSTSNALSNGIPNGIKPIIQITNLTSANRLSTTPQTASSPTQHTPPRPNSPPSNVDLTQESSSPLLLSPIEENDGSPYSTSSTNRSSKSSNYPTTSTIFGRKPSPPPPKSELPPIPTQPLSQPSNGSTTSSRSDENSPKAALRALDNVIESQTNDEGEEVFESDSDDPYQTISEVGEAKAEYIRSMTPNLREYYNKGRRLSKENQELMLKKIKSLTSVVNKSSQASLTPEPTNEDEVKGHSSFNSPRSTPKMEHIRIDSYDKCTNTEADFCNNNMSRKGEPEGHLKSDPEGHLKGDPKSVPPVKCDPSNENLAPTEEVFV